MAHTSEVLAQFQDGEVRMVFGRDRDTDTLFLLPDGDARALRSWAKGQLVCPVRDCPDPKLTTVARSRGRDGFRHLTGTGGHALESLFHLQACERIALWLRTRHPTCAVRKEETSKSGERRADVMITAPDGRQIAFEIQYAALTPDQWQTRHDSYAADNIVDVWLFGHHGAHLRPARGPHLGDHDVALNSTHAAVVAAGLPLLWFNPLTADVGTATDTVTVHGRRFEVPAGDRSGRFTVESLDALRLNRDGLTSDRLRQLAAARDKLGPFQLAVEFAEAARAAAARAAQAEQEARELAAAEAAEAKLAVRRAGMAVAAAALEAEWLDSDLRTELLERFDGVWPKFLDVTTAKEPGLPMPQQQWQATAFNQFIHGQPIGRQVVSSACAAKLDFAGLNHDESAAIIREWFDALVKFGYLARRPVRRYGEAPGVSYTTTALRLPMRSRPLPVQRSRRTVDVEPAHSGPIRSERPSKVLCSICRWPLAEMFVAQGFHTMCRRGWPRWHNVAHPR